MERRIYAGLHRGSAVDPPATSNASFRRLVAHREFRAMWLAIGQSQFGDQLGRVALSILVFSATGSGVATASVYALTYLPAVVGGVLLSGLADRYPRRGLLVTCDLLRAALFACMAIPAVPIWAVAALLTVAVVVGSPHKAAEPAVVADMFDGDQYSAALGIRTATVQVAQLTGFAIGGALVAVTSARAVLALDAASFGLSAGLLYVYLVPRPRARLDSDTQGLLRRGIHIVWADQRLRVLLAFSWLAGFWIVPEGLAAPYAAGHGGGATSVGGLLAANPIGVALGALLLTRLVPATIRTRAIGPLAIASGLPLALCWGGPGIPAAILLWGLCGLLSAYQVLVIAEFVSTVPAGQRGQAIGIGSAGLMAVQGVGLLVGGAIASLTGAAPAIAIAGAAGTALSIVVTLWGNRVRRSYRQTTSEAGR
jgi:predicted MFS family arabinose efflux permease